MKEVLTQSFWRGVKKTFLDALEETPAQKKAVEAAVVEEPVAEGKPKESPAAETPQSHGNE